MKDGVADTSAEYRAAGRAAGAQWTVAGHVDSHGWAYRLELEACQVATGRVESLAREIDPRQAAPQIAEMLALLLRSQGVGDTVPPWDQPAPTPPPLAPAPPPTPAPAPLPPPRRRRRLRRPPRAALRREPPVRARPGRRSAGAFARASDARGSATAGLVTLHGALRDRRRARARARRRPRRRGGGTELVRGGRRGSLRAPDRPLSARLRRPRGDARRLLRARRRQGRALPRARRAPDRRGARRASVQIEAYPEIAYAAGGTAGLGLVGGGLRGVFRF